MGFDRSNRSGGEVRGDDRPGRAASVQAEGCVGGRWEVEVVEVEVVTGGDRFRDGDSVNLVG